MPLAARPPAQVLPQGSSPLLLRFFPAASLMSANPVAIRTHEVALGDLGLKHRDRNPSVMIQRRDVEEFDFTFTMIEIQYIRGKPQATIGTGAILCGSEDRLQFSPVPQGTLHVALTIVLVMLSFPCRMTRLTVAL